MMSRVSLIAGAVVGAILALVVFYLLNQAIWLPAAREEGAEGSTNAEIRNLDPGDLCRELGGRWVLDHCE